MRNAPLTVQWLKKSLSAMLAESVERCNMAEKNSKELVTCCLVV
jgi:hypothetical protein